METSDANGLACPMISIIIPVYKAEKYLHKCIDSIIAQSFKDWELLLIDDGSPDSSGKICDEYAVKDSRIKVFHKENGGVSSARNFGLDNANGIWITFVDADDWLESKALEISIDHSDGIEIIRFGYKTIFNDAKIVSDARLNESWTYEEYLSKVISRRVSISIWGGLYAHALINKYKIRFCTEYSFAEDWLVLFNILKQTKKLKIINKPLYNYNMMNQESAVHTLNINKTLQLIEVASIICKNNSIGNNIDFSTCKCDVCAKSLANMLLNRSNRSTYRVVIDSIIHKKIYPSLSEIRQSFLPIKFKLLLLVFNIYIYALNVSVK